MILTNQGGNLIKTLCWVTWTQSLSKILHIHCNVIQPAEHTTKPNITQQLSPKQCPQKKSFAKDVFITRWMNWVALDCTGYIRRPSLPQLSLIY